MSYTIEMIAELIGATRVGNTNTTIDWLLTDSRLLSFPEETLFFALQTKQEDGIDQIPDLYARGVRNFVVNAKGARINAPAPIVYSDYPDSNFLLVPNSLKALQKLAEQHRAQYHIPVVGIAGSSGKTMVKEWLYQLLSEDRIIVRSPHSYVSQIGVPLSVWQMNDQTDLAIIEAGISEAGEMRTLQNIIKPTIGILTSVGGARKEKFFSVQERCTEELALFKDCDVVIYNGDNHMMSNCVGKSLLSAREIAWSRVDKDKPLYISSVEKGTAHTTVTYQYLGMNNTFRIPFTDDISIENALNSLAVCLYLMLSPETITRRMASLEPMYMGLEGKEDRNSSMPVDGTVLEVNLSALINNLNYFRSKVEPSTKTVCMVKAFAYGAGSIEVGRAFQEQLVDYLGVAVTDEGVALREGGITSSIIVMNPERASFKDLFTYRLEPEVYNFHILEALIKEAGRDGILYFPVHIKVDTGMHRLGFDPTEIPLLIKRLKEQNTVIPRSIFSHLSGSDGEEFDDFTRHQITLFDKVSTEFQAAFSHRILRHISNSAGAERFSKEAQFDMIRLGIGLYGVNPRDNSIINNVSTLRSTIMQIRNVPPGETVGYSRRGKITKDSRIAVLRIGYGDGLNRHLGNGNFYCLVNGQKAPYVGNICMDLCMIDVTGIDCKEGDKVVIFGNDLPVTWMANQLGTISYEVLTGVSARVKRVYFYD